MINTTIGETLFDGRRAVGKTMQQVGQEIGLALGRAPLSRFYISSIESGDEVPADEVLRAWAMAVGLDPLEVIDRSDHIDQDLARWCRETTGVASLLRRIRAYGIDPRSVEASLVGATPGRRRRR